MVLTRRGNDCLGVLLRTPRLNDRRLIEEMVVLHGLSRNWNSVARIGIDGGSRRCRILMETRFLYDSSVATTSRSQRWALADIISAMPLTRALRYVLLGRPWRAVLQSSTSAGNITAAKPKPGWALV